MAGHVAGGRRSVTSTVVGYKKFTTGEELAPARRTALARSAADRGPDTGPVILIIEYPDMAAYGARTAFENANAEWKQLFASQPDSPETLLSVELLTSFEPPA